MSTPITAVQVRTELDALTVLVQTRQITSSLGFSSLEQTRVCAAIWEILQRVPDDEEGSPMEIVLHEQYSDPHLLFSFFHSRWTPEDFEPAPAGAQMFMEIFDVNAKAGEGVEVVLKRTLPQQAPILTQEWLREIRQGLLHLVDEIGDVSAGGQRKHTSSFAQLHQDFLSQSQSLYKSDQQIDAAYSALEEAAQPSQSDETTGSAQTAESTERKAAEAQHGIADTHDLLTDLPMRDLFFERFRMGVTRLAQSASQGLMAVLLLEVSNFKEIRNQFDSACANELLITTADRINRRLRSLDTAARLGEDDFAVLLENVPDESTAWRVAEEYLMLVQQPFLYEDETITPRITIGISMYPVNALKLETLLKQTAKAIQKAKDNFASLLFYEP